MANRGRGYSQGDWGDSMKEEFDSSHYEQQYDDEDASELVQLDHCRLYITNIPKGLSSEGLKAVFTKFGTLQEYYLNADPQKRFALIMYETPGEAKLAMMKLNRTEPMKLNISLAHKKKRDEPKGKGKDWSARNRDGDSSNGPRERGSRDDVSHHKDRSSQADVSHRHRQEREDSSVKSRGRR